MTSIVVNRATPFRRGDTSINIFLDGKAAGSLLSNDSLAVDAAPGAHELQAFSNGTHGRKYHVELREGESIRLQVQPWPQFAINVHWWESLVLIAALIISGRVFGRFGIYIQAALFAVFVAVSIVRLVRMRKERRNFLRIAPPGEVTPG